MYIYKASDDVNQADCLIVHSFGTSTGMGSVNHELGVFALRIAGDRPIIADRAISDSLPEYADRIALIVTGEAATHIKVGGKIPTPTIGGDGTWGTLNVAKQYMDDHRLTHPLMVAQAWHASRVAKQAAKLDMGSILPKGLPRNFDKQSSQFWTRSLCLWIPVNLLGSLLLKRRGQL